MTCIIGIESNGKVYMGGDSSAISGWENERINFKKVFITSGVMIGYSTSFRMGQIIEAHLDIPTFGEGGMYYMVNLFIPALRSVLKDNGFTTIENNHETAGSLLVGISGHLYRINEDFSVTRAMDGFTAIGIGNQFALGAMAGIMRSNQPKKEPDKMILQALEIAGYFSIGVSEPYYVMSL